MTMVMTGTRSFFTKKTSTNLSKPLTEAVDYVKTELMPNFDFDAFNHDEVPAENGESEGDSEAEVSSSAAEHANPSAGSAGGSGFFC